MSQPAGIGVLVVEDEFIQALELKSTLASLGYAILGIAGSGEDAIRLAAETEPALVLMDINLSGTLDGIDAALAIREARPVPVIFVTAFSDDETLARVQASSPYGYIVKPYRERDLKICMEMALAKFGYETMLVRARELAEANDRAKSRFLANISHELKTPLNAIVGFTELAQSMSRDAEQSECLVMAMRGVRRLEATIESLLDYTKLESGEHMPIMASFRVPDLLRRVVDSCLDEAESKELSLSAECDPGLPERGWGDAGKLASILGGLLGNAVKFTDSGFVRLRAGGGPDGALVFTVEDSGRGISDASRVLSFKAFCQGDDSPTREHGGLGLGLTVAKGLADVLGASLEYGAREGGGSRFTVALPGALSAEPGRDGARR